MDINNLFDIDFEEVNFNMTIDDILDIDVDNLLTGLQVCDIDSAFYYCNLTEIYCGFCCMLNMQLYYKDK